MEIQITKEGYKKLLEKAMAFKIEERDLALDRYRRQDTKIDTPEDFILQGANNIKYLAAASLASNELFKLAESIQKIIYKDDLTTKETTVFSDELKKAFEDEIKKIDKEK